ncbi:MAG: threonine-phosphate decarboxylase [Nitrospirae bacterium]|nr:threonine-phosphate decarboxylase [Nitrospirota bacterium]
MKTPHKHGGDIYAATRESGRRLDQLVDFSASINPLGPSPKAMRAIKVGLSHVLHYPDPDCVALRQVLAKRWHLSPDRFAIGNGSSELIYLLPHALFLRHAVVVGPTFSEYERAVVAAGGRVTHVHATRRAQYQPSVEHILGAVQRGRRRIDALFLCNPNSPTGQVLEAASVLRIARRASAQGIWVIVDETFVEYCEEATVLSQVARLPRLLVLRSLTKFYALPGLRIGYLAGAQDVIATLRAKQPPWSVNALAQEAACVALHDQWHVRQSLAFMRQERQRLVLALQALPGLTVFPSAANFLLIELPRSSRAGHCVLALRRQGLLIRDCSSVAGLNERTIRVAVRTPAQNRRVVGTLQRWLAR